MICPKCGGEFQVTSSRANADTVVRRRVCKQCKHIVYTKEVLTDSVFFLRSDKCILLCEEEQR